MKNILLNKLRFILIIMLSISIFLCSCKKNEELEDTTTNGKTTAVFNPDLTYGTLTDQDGNIYKTIQIGTQTWMAENLRTTKFNDGTSIPNVTDDQLWSHLGSEAYCTFYDTTDVVFIATYGRYYNWFAVNSGKLAPAGWHIPSEEDWNELFAYIEDKGANLIEAGGSHWINLYGTNSTGLTILPGAYNDAALGTFCSFWSTTEYIAPAGNDNAICWQLFDTDGKIYSKPMPKVVGMTIRCIKD